MQEARTIDENSLDLQRVIKGIKAYELSTGMHCVAIDPEGNMMQDLNVNILGCKFCRQAQSILGNGLGCRGVHRYGNYQAERFGGKYVFFCPMGLTHWISPIVYEGRMHGALLGGPVLMVEPDEFLMEDLIRNNNIDDSQMDKLRQYIKDIPVVKPDVVDSLAELLFIVASHISGSESLHHIDSRQYMEQQADISEYIHYIKTMGGNDEKPPSYPIEKERELLSMISVGDKAGSQKVLNEIFGYVFFSTGGDFEIIKARVLELVVLLSRAALEGGADVEQIFGLNYRYLNEIHGFKNVEELSYWLSRIMGRFTDCVFNLASIKHTDVMYKAVDYIKRNYMKKISLDEVASNVYLSPSYFSKLFKEEMGCNFVTYLNRYRVKASMRLLLDENVELVDVSSFVGYEDQSYFSKIFKKFTGVTPGKYRESRGNAAIK